MSLLLNKDVKSLAFPTLVGGAILNPKHKGALLSYSAIAKFLARHHDRKFAKRTDFLLFVNRKKQLLTLASHVNTIMRMSKLRLENPLTVDSILQNNGLNEALKKDEVFQVLSKIRSSPAFWKKEQSDLMAMIR